MFLFQILPWFLDGLNKNDRVWVKTWVGLETWNTSFSFWSYRELEIMDLAISLTSCEKQLI